MQGQPDFDETFRANLRSLFAWRRDVRRFSSQRLPDGAIERLIDLARLSPSVGLSQPWRFVIVDDPGRRRAVLDHFKACNTAALKSFSGELATRYARLKLAGLEEAPSQIAVFADRTTQVGHGLGQSTMPETAEYSAVAAICTICLRHVRKVSDWAGFLSSIPSVWPKSSTSSVHGTSSDISAWAIRRWRATLPNSNGKAGNGVDPRPTTCCAGSGLGPAEPFGARPRALWRSSSRSFFTDRRDRAARLPGHGMIDWSLASILDEALVENMPIGLEIGCNKELSLRLGEQNLVIRRLGRVVANLRRMFQHPIGLTRCRQNRGADDEEIVGPSDQAKFDRPEE